MEIKATLLKPFDEIARMDFIVEYNHKQGYKIEETETELQALGQTEEEIKEQEQKRIAKLSLTKREVFLALYKSKGITPDMIKNQINDPQALIEFEYANDYFRGNPLVDLLGGVLGCTKADLDYLFINKSLPDIEAD